MGGENILSRVRSLYERIKTRTLLHLTTDAVRIRYMAGGIFVGGCIAFSYSNLGFSPTKHDLETFVINHDVKRRRADIVEIINRGERRAAALMMMPFVTPSPMSICPPSLSKQQLLPASRHYQLIEEVYADLEGLQGDHPQISFPDLITFAATVATETRCAGITINWRQGRKIEGDYQSINSVAYYPRAGIYTPWQKVPVRCNPENTTDDSTKSVRGQWKTCPPSWDLPSSDPAAITVYLKRELGRRGFTDREIVALVGAMANDFNVSTDYFKELARGRWVLEGDSDSVWVGEDTASTKGPIDIALIRDRSLYEEVKVLAEDGDLLRASFSSAYSKYLELGSQFKNQKFYCSKLTSRKGWNLAEMYEGDHLYKINERGPDPA